MADAYDISDLNLAGKVTFGKLITRGGYSDISEGTLVTESTGFFNLIFGKSTIRKVAIKALRIQGSSDTPEADERLRKHFYREILLWRKLEHSNIVPLLGYLMPPDEPPNLISPWYTNGNVLRYLRLQPNADRHALALDVVSGLEYLHSIPVAHGDLKGENVLVDDGGRAGLCDFGMSQFIDDANRISGFTTTNANTGGTDRFMCPEILEDEPRSPTTDIWAVGCLILQILTDEIPYQQIAKKSAVYAAILRGTLPFVNRNDSVPIALWECIQTCWSITPSERPTASQIALHFKPPEDRVKPTAKPTKESLPSAEVITQNGPVATSLKRKGSDPAARRLRTRKLLPVEEQEEVQENIVWSRQKPDRAGAYPTRPQQPVGSQTASSYVIALQNTSESPTVNPSPKRLVARQTTPPEAPNNTPDSALFSSKAPKNQSARNQNSEAVLTAKSTVVTFKPMTPTTTSPSPLALPRPSQPPAPSTTSRVQLLNQPSMSGSSEVKVNSLQPQPVLTSSILDPPRAELPAIPTMTYWNPLTALKVLVPTSTTPTTYVHQSRPSLPLTYFSRSSDTIALGWFSSDPLQSQLYSNNGLFYRFETTGTNYGKLITTLWRTTRNGRDERVAKLQWGPNRTLGRAIIGRNSMSMSELVDPDFKSNSTSFNGPDGFQYRWRRKDPLEMLLQDQDQNIIAVSRSFSPPMMYNCGELYGELCFDISVGGAKILHQPLMDIVCITAMLYRVLDVLDFRSP